VLDIVNPIRIEDGHVIIEARTGKKIYLKAGAELVIDETGIGIGITPSYLFHVDGDVAIYNKLYVTRGSDVWTPLDIDFPDVSTNSAPVLFYKNTNTSGVTRLRFYKGDGTETETIRLDTKTGEISYHSLNDWTCANFKAYSDDELLKIIDLHPRNDGIYHRSNPNGKAFPHIDFSKVHDDIATIAEEDRLVGPVYRYDEKKKKFIETKMQYRKGEKSGVDFGSLVYAMAEIVLRMNNRISQLEEQINEIR